MRKSRNASLLVEIWYPYLECRFKAQDSKKGNLMGRGRVVSVYQII